MEDIATLPRTLERHTADLILSLFAVWAVALVAGIASHVAGATLGVAGGLGVLAYHARDWIIPRLRDHEMLRDPAIWGITVLAVAPFFPARLGPSVVGLSVDDLPIFVGTALLLYGVSRREGLRSLLHPVAIPMVLFAIWAGIAGTLARDPFAGFQALGRWGVIAAAFAAVIVVTQRRGYARYVVGAILVFGLIQGLLGLWSYYADWTLNNSERLYHIGLERWRPWESQIEVSPGRITGTLGVSSNFYGAVMIIPITIAVAAFGGAETGRGRIAYGLTAVTLFLAMSLSFTRASIAAAVLGSLIVLIATRKWRIAPLIAVALLVVSLFTPVVSRFGYENNRLALLATSISLILTRPFTGIGDFGAGAKELLNDEELSRVTNELGEVITPHNSFLRAAAETGIAGGLLLLIGAILPGIIALYGAFRRWPEQTLLAGIAGGLAGFGLQAFSNNLFHIPNAMPYYWLAAGAAVGVVWVHRARERSRPGGLDADIR